VGYQPILPVLATIFAVGVPCKSQQLPDAEQLDAKAAAVRDAVKTRLDAGKAALSAKDAAQAVRHFSNSLWWDPHAANVLAEIAAAAGSNEDAQTLWLHQLAASVADERGGFELPEPLRKLTARDPMLAKVASARADAAAQLATVVREQRGKDGDAAVAARWVFGVASDVIAPSPALRKKHAPACNQPLASTAFEHKQVLAALKEVMDKALGEQRPELAIRAAQCLLGLASQSRFKDLEGPKPPALDGVAMAARAGLARAREQIDARRKGGIPTIQQLEAMSPEEREAFTREHSSFENPGVTLSPNGLYRIETSCGHATLLGVAKTVELHHARLVKYFGQDPFTGQPGLVRIVPESSGLEAEGTPFWWAGGFQSGPVTTVKFSCSTIGQLGHGLTHELTHRFDGGIFGGIPSWLAEGKAVWTGAAFGPPEDAEFVPNHASLGTAEAAYYKGYTDEKNIKKLVDGTLEDYRDNYTAGYAMFLYLSTWREKDALLYGDRLVKFQQGCKEKGGNSLEWFTQCFCDGKAGRPKDWKAFAAKFGEFVKGFYWQNRAPWTSTLYTQKVPHGTGDPWVWDAPTWHQSRSRAEPWFGQDQARIGGEILLEAGRKREAAAAFEWSLLVDEWRPEIADKLARLLDQDNRQGAAWLVRSECARRFPGREPLTPVPGIIASTVSRLTALADALRAAHASYKGRGLAQSAAAMAADHDRLAARLGMKPIGAAAPAPDLAASLHPLDEPPRALGLYGWEEDKLTGYEEKRVKDLWYVVPEGDLHVGREKPREGTGITDRAAHQRDAFTRTREWIAAGRYVISARIQCNTSFTAGSVVFGFSRRDRNVRLGFSGGDFLYSIGAKEEKTEFGGINTHLHGLREREGGLWGSAPGHRVEFKPPSGSFVLRILVDGPAARAYVNDQLVGAYHTADGHAIEGCVGFAASQGAYVVTNATVERRDRTAAAAADPSWPQGLDPRVAKKQVRGELLNAACRGIPTGPSGTLVLWIPDLTTPAGPALEIDYSSMASSAVMGLDEALRADGLKATFLVCLPESLSAEARASIEADVKRNSARAAPHVLTHRSSGTLTIRKDGDGPEEPTASLLFIDPASVVRVIDGFDRGQRSFSHHMRQWLGVFESLASAKKSQTDPKGG
jgi:hypothetical protein